MKNPGEEHSKSNTHDNSCNCHRTVNQVSRSEQNLLLMKINGNLHNKYQNATHVIKQGYLGSS